MKKITLKLVGVLFYLCITTLPVTTLAALGGVEGGSTIYFIKEVNVSQKYIKISGIEVAFNSSTLIHDSKGNKISAADLSIGKAVRFSTKPDARFFKRPLATKIWLIP